jgi:6-phosphofructokinase
MVLKIAVLTSGGAAPGMNAALRAAAVEALADEDAGTMVGLCGDEICRVPLDDIVGEQRQLDPDLYRLAGVLSALPEQSPGASTH